MGAVYHAVIFISPDYSTEVHEVAQEGWMNFMSWMSSRTSAEYGRNIRRPDVREIDFFILSDILHCRVLERNERSMTGG